MRLQPVNLGLYVKIHQLYRTSFPFAERMPLPILWYRARGKQAWADFYAIYEGSDMIGFTYLIHEASMTVIQYLVIAPKWRGRGYGSQVLDLIKQCYPEQTLVLEIEHVSPLESDYEMRLKRQRFYERNGFQLADFCSYYYVLFDLMYLGKDFDIERYCKLTHRFLLKLLHPQISLRQKLLLEEKERSVT